MEQDVRWDASVDPARRPSTGEFTTALVHLYRAEAARAYLAEPPRYDDQLGRRQT